MLSNYIHRFERIIVDNSPAILTAVGITGTITTAILTGKATVKAVRLLDNEEYILEMQDQPPLDLREKVERTWTFYLPAMVSGSLTIACIVGANRIGTRRAAALAAAYSLSERAFSDYKDKVVEIIGDKKEEKVRAAIAQDQVNANPVSSREVIITGNGDVLCYDTITGRYFESSVETLRRIQNDINQQILSSMYVTLYEFYEKIGLPTTIYSSEVGWNTENFLELEFSAIVSDDGRPCLAIGYKPYPVRNYY